MRKPVIKVFDTTDDEIGFVSEWIKEQIENNVIAHEIGVFVRSAKEFNRAKTAIEKAGYGYKILDENLEYSRNHISICTMHLAKGLEYRSIVVMACDDEVIPSQERIELVGDENDLEEVYNTERHLLYVACTRARDHLLVTSTSPASEFLDDMGL